LARSPEFSGVDHGRRREAEIQATASYPIFRENIEKETTFKDVSLEFSDLCHV